MDADFVIAGANPNVKKALKSSFAEKGITIVFADDEFSQRIVPVEPLPEIDLSSTKAAVTVNPETRKRSKKGKRLKDWQR